MSPPTLKIMDEKLTVSYSELTGSPSMSAYVTVGLADESVPLDH